MDVVPRATHPSNQWARACYRGLSSKATTSVPGLCGQLSLQPPDSFYKFQWFSFLQALIIKIITQIKKIRKNVPTSMLSRVTQNKVLVCQTRWDCCEHFYASIPIDLKSGCLGSKYHSFSCYNGSKAKPLWPLMDFDPWCFVYLFTTFSRAIRCYVEVHRSYLRVRLSQRLVNGHQSTDVTNHNGANITIPWGYSTVFLCII